MDVKIKDLYYNNKQHLEGLATNLPEDVKLIDICNLQLVWNDLVQDSFI